eukprot:3742_1
MGNELATNVKFYDDKTISGKTKLSKFIKSKLNMSRCRHTKTNAYEEFIIKHKRLKRNNESIIDINSLDQRRIVFVSLLGLFQSWKQCPCYQLYTSLIIIPLKRAWVYRPSKYIKEIKSHVISHVSAFSDPSETKQFIELLRWKDSQGLVFWMLDD